LWIAGLPVTPGRTVGSVLDGILDGTLEDAIRKLTSLDGAFSAFVWDPTTRKLAIVTDFLGLQPLYMRRTPGALHLAGTIRELADGTPDPAGWGAFVGLGHFIASRTSAADVTRVGPAAILEYEVDADRLSERTYWQWPEVDPRVTAADVDTGELLDLLTASVDGYAAYGSEGTVLLSGGFESRLLAALLVRAGRRPQALTLANPYEHLEIDGRFAARVARELGMRHTLRFPDENFFSTERFLEYVRRSDVATTSVNLFIAQVCAELQAARVEASWDGVCYGIVIKDKSEASFDAFLRKALKRADSPVWRAARGVFAGSFADAMAAELDRVLREEISRYDDRPEGVAEFFVRNRARNRTTPNALKVYAHDVLPFMPGLTRTFYERAVRIPPAVKAYDALYRRIFERHFPALARVPFCSGGKLLPGSGTGLGYVGLKIRSAVVEHRRVGQALRRLGLTPARPETATVAAAVRGANLDDPLLNADVVRRLQRTPPQRTNDDTLARELVFYWEMWKETMAGSPQATAACSPTA
jgi:asparagine synthetase B (glutamine-hydrolysing)